MPGTPPRIRGPGRCRNGSRKASYSSGSQMAWGEDGALRAEASWSLSSEVSRSSLQVSRLKLRSHSGPGGYRTALSAGTEAGAQL
eukprot:5944782-Alexandrium_andersonii.AAC.1